MTRQRILYVEMAHGLGGSVISLYQLLRGLDRERYEPIVLFYWDNTYVSRFRDLGIETIVWAGPRQGSAVTTRSRTPPPTLPSGRSRKWAEGIYHNLGFYKRIFVETLPLAWRIRRVIRAMKVDAVHANDLVGCNREAIIAAWLTGRSCLCHIRAFETYTPLDRLLVRFVDKFLFISQAIAQSCISQGVDPARGEVVYNALDLVEFRALQPSDREKERERLELSRDSQVVGIIGRLVRWKGHEVFLQAMAIVAEAIPKLECLIIGEAEASDSAYRQELGRLAAQLKLSDKVRFLGWRGDIPHLLSAMDILVHSSLEPEPFGRVIIEGMAAGKAVVAAAAGACPEIIEDGVSGLLVPPGDASALAQAVIRLLQDPEGRHAMGLTARRQVETRFSIEAHVRQIERIYAQTLGRP